MAAEGEAKSKELFGIKNEEEALVLLKIRAIEESKEKIESWAKSRLYVFVTLLSMILGVAAYFGYTNLNRIVTEVSSERLAEAQKQFDEKVKELAHESRSSMEASIRANEAAKRSTSINDDLARREHEVARLLDRIATQSKEAELLMAQVRESMDRLQQDAASTKAAYKVLTESIENQTKGFSDSLAANYAESKKAYEASQKRLELIEKEMRVLISKVQGEQSEILKTYEQMLAKIKADQQGVYSSVTENSAFRVTIYHTEQTADLIQKVTAGLRTLGFDVRRYDMVLHEGLKIPLAWEYEIRTASSVQTSRMIYEEGAKSVVELISKQFLGSRVVLRSVNSLTISSAPDDARLRELRELGLRPESDKWMMQLRKELPPIKDFEWEKNKAWFCIFVERISIFSR